MKAFLIPVIAALALFTGCSSSDLETKAEEDLRNPDQEPFSKEQIETLDERAGAQTQSREGIEDNPFIEGRPNGDSRRQRRTLP